MVIRESAVENLGMISKCWEGKRVLVTGHSGFKGGWLCLWLGALGAEVIGLALDPPTETNLFTIAGIGENIRSFNADIRDFDRVSGIFEDVRPEIVFHMAAQSLVRESYSDPRETYSTNVMGTVNVLEASRITPTVRVVINVTSDKCYSNREWVWGYRENDPVGGHDPYSSSKGCAELVSAAYLSSFFSDSAENDANRVALASVRAGNVIGGGDWAKDRLIPDCIRSLSRGDSVLIRNPYAVRPWQHVLDPLSGYIQLAERLLESNPSSFCGPWNFGPDVGDHITAGDLAHKVCELWGDGAVILAEGTSGPHEAGLLRLDVTKARTRLGWRRRWDLDRALRETVAWYKAWHNGEDMRAYTLAQIAAYRKES